MPNNPGVRRAGAPVQVGGGNKLVRRQEQESAVAAIVSSSKDNTGSPASTPDTSAIPAGVIVMWSGTLATVPLGWKLCDGSGGTPDLRDKFIYGWTAATDPGGTGGTLTHLHPVGTLANGAVSAGTPAGTIDAHTTTAVTPTGATNAFTGPGTHTFTGAALGTHNHTITGSTAINVSGNALPPYYKLAFIMKAA